MPKKSLWKHVCVVELLVSIYFLFIKNVSFYKFEHDICNVISFGRYILVSKYNSSLISVLIAVKNTPAVTAYRHRCRQREQNGTLRDTVSKRSECFETITGDQQGFKVSVSFQNNKQRETTSCFCIIICPCHHFPYPRRHLTLIPLRRQQACDVSVWPVSPPS